MTVKPTTVVIGSGMTGGIRPTGHFSHPAARRSSSVSDEREREQRRRSIVILSLLAACAFLFVLSLCLLTALVMVGRNLSNVADSSHSQLTAAVSDESLTPVYGNSLSSNKGTEDDDLSYGAAVADDSGKKIARNESDITGTDVIAQSHNRSTIFLPNSVYHTVSPGRMNRVLKMGSQVAEKLSFRLPRHVRPVHYELWLHPDLQRETFAGRVGIDLNVTEPTNYIVLHSKKLTITETVLRELTAKNQVKDGAEVSISRTYEVPEHEYWVIETQADIAAGEYRLSMQFNGSLADRIIGFYSSKYLDKKTNTTR